MFLRSLTRQHWLDLCKGRARGGVCIPSSPDLGGILLGVQGEVGVEIFLRYGEGESADDPYAYVEGHTYHEEGNGDGLCVDDHGSFSLSSCINKC